MKEGVGSRFHKRLPCFSALINELENTVALFDYVTEMGMLIERQTISTLPKDFEGKSHCADVKITSDGRFLYGTN